MSRTSVRYHDVLFRTTKQHTALHRPADRNLNIQFHRDEIEQYKATDKPPIDVHIRRPLDNDLPPVPRKSQMTLKEPVDLEMTFRNAWKLPANGIC